MNSREQIRAITAGRPADCCELWLENSRAAWHYGMNYKTMRHYFDIAAESNIPYHRLTAVYEEILQ